MSNSITAANRGRPRSEEKREAILTAAKSLLLEHGYASTSLEMIAERSGIGKPTIYRHFGSKEDLAEAVIYLREQELVAALQPFRNTDNDVATDLYEFADRFVALVLDSDATLWARLVIAEAGRLPSLAKTLFKAGPKRLHEVLRDFIDEANEEGTLSADDPDAAAEHLIGLLFGLELLRVQMASQPRRTKAEKRTRARTAVDMFLQLYGMDH